MYVCLYVCLSGAWRLWDLAEILYTCSWVSIRVFFPIILIFEAWGRVFSWICLKFYNFTIRPWNHLKTKFEPSAVRTFDSFEILGFEYWPKICIKMCLRCTVSACVLKLIFEKWTCLRFGLVLLRYAFVGLGIVYEIRNELL